MSNEKWMLYNNIEWKRSGTSEMNHHQVHQRLVFFQGDVVYILGLEESFIMSSYWKTKQSQQLLLPIRLTENSTQQKVSN